MERFFGVIKVKKFITLLLILSLVLTSAYMVAAEDSISVADGFEQSGGTPFIMYEDEKGIRYIGPTGDTTQISEELPENTDKDESPAGKNRLVAVGSNNLPSSVDLSTSKYFPAIESQGSINSCATWATVYYQFTYEMNRLRGTAATPENTASPKFVYNILADKNGSGTSAEENYAVLKSQGAPSISTLPFDEEYLSWNPEEKIWREALNCRLEDYKDLGYIGRDGRDITSPDDSDLNEIKTALNNGRIVTFSSFITSWVYDTIKAHTDAPENSKYAGEKIVKYMDGLKGSHRMVIVGYNDEIWFDHNSNGKVDAGEKGAFKIANSWGTTFANKGFCWVSYDALNKETSVDGGYAESDRSQLMTGFTTITVRPYKENSGIYLKFTLNSADRTQCIVKVTAEHNGTTETGTFLSGINYTLSDNKSSYRGNTSADDGTFCYALDNVSPELTAENFNEYSFTVTVKDSKSDTKSFIVKNLELVNEYTGKTYKPSVSIPTLNGSEQTVDIKSPETDNKVIYYIGFDEPLVHYLDNGVWKEAEMEKNEEHSGHNYKYVIKDLPGNVYLYFTDKNGNKDDNSGKYYVANERLNYFRTMNVREPLVLKDFIVDPEVLDAGTNGYLIPEASGGYEPYYYQFTFEHIESGKVSVEKFKKASKVMHYFEKEGQYRITAEVRDQSGDIATLTKTITIKDLPFEFSALTAAGKDGGNLFVGEDVIFDARTNFEQIAYMKNAYEFVVKDSNGKICSEASVKPYESYTSFGYSRVSYNWIPDKKGVYTVTVSETDDNGEYAEKSLTFTVLDKLYGDANGDGIVSIKDATAIQKSLAGLSQDFVFMAQFADCDTNGVVSIKDATCIRKFIAGVNTSGKAGQAIGYSPSLDPSEPETTVPVTQPKPVTTNTVTFTNSHKWSGTISCYYWSDSNKTMTSWPGKAMTNAGTNEFNETLYTFNVPEGATYVIFTNGSAQTVDIPYSGSDVKYYPLTETDSQGHYKVANW